MGEKEQIVCEVVKTACHEYFLNRSTAYIIARCISLNMPILGLLKPEWEQEFFIENEYQHVTKISEDTYMVSNRIRLVDSLEKSDDRFETLVDVTFSCILIEDEVKFGSVHMSRSNEPSIKSNLNKDNNYKKVLGYLYDVIFEYDSTMNTFSYDPVKHRELFQVDAYYVSMDQWFWHICTECVHKDDTEALDIFRSNDIGKRIRNNDLVIEDEIRIKNKENGYIWLKMVVIFVPNKNKDAVEKVYVMFKNINEHKNKEIEYMYKARIDSLTGINNREYTETLIKQFLEENPNNKGVYVLIDVDDFKLINDTFGHIAGDEVLKKTAKAIKDTVSDNDIVGRYGGDEFVVFFKNCEDNKIAKTKLSDIVKSIEHTYSEGKKSMNVRCSAGATIATNTNCSLDELFKIADENLYESKRAGKNTFTITRQ